MPVDMAAQNKKTETKRPNILFIMSDDHSYQTIGAYGHGLNQTPNIDRIAQSGMLFRNSYVGNSISGPCRAIVLTGMHSHMNGFYDNGGKSVFDGSQTTFPKLLQSAGYQTAIIGKWHLVSTPTGFDHYCIHTGQGSYYGPDMIEPDGKKTYKGEYATDLTLRKSVEWLDGRDDSKPFCLMMHFKAPHRNWMPAPQKMDMYEDATFPLPATFYDDYRGRRAAAEQKMSIDKDMTLEWDTKMLGIPGASENLEKAELSRMTPEQRAAFDRVYGRIQQDFTARNLQGKELAEWKYQRYMRDYLKVISSVDDNVGLMIDYLEKNGLWENTIVVYTADQGFYMGEHGWFDKRFMYEESFRAPLMIHYPPLIKKGGVENRSLVQNIDFAPTFLDLAGVEVPEQMQGESLRPILSGKKQKIRNALYYHYYEFPLPHAVKRHFGIRDERYKLIHFYYNIDTWELFDLKNDPQEMNNLIDDPKYKNVIAGLKTKLKELQVKYKDTEPMNTYRLDREQVGIKGFGY
ncbi:sulfatase [Bacteroidia bacterium]|nr:sulfatase [Bacteroidia bacterium]